MRFSYFPPLALIVCACTAMSPALAQSDLESLPVATQNEIGRICSPVQFRQGAAAYRNCVRSELSARANQTESPMGKLSFDDKYAVQQACAKAGSESTNAFQTCVKNEITGLNREPEPAISSLSEDEQYAVQQACFGAQSNAGAIAYRRCMNNQINELKTLPSVSLATMSLLDRNALQLKCSETTASAGDYRRCLAIATDVALPPKGAIVTTANTSTTALPRAITPPGKELVNEVETEAQTAPTVETEAPSTNNEPIQPTEVASAPEAEVATEVTTEVTTEAVTETVTNQEQNTLIAIPDDTQTEPESTESVATGAMEKALDLWQQAVEWFQTLPVSAKALMAALIVAPLALLALLSGRRRRHDELYDAAYSTGGASVRYDGPSLKNRVHAQFEEFDADDSQLDANMFADDSSALDELFEEHEGPAYAKNSGADLTQPTNVAEHHSDLQPVPAMRPSDERVTRMAAKQDFKNSHADTRIDASFGDWLQSEPAELRRQHCIEFLIYWIAYSDERYDPALKLRLFQAVELDAHDTIKRWVLKEDVFAFADAVAWIREHCELSERGECIQLFIALLITENALTPVQNTLLRFLSDSFGLGNSMDELYQEAFGSSMPAIPRVDKIAWWEKRSLEEIDLWDSRLVSTWPPMEQYRARLGLDPDFTETAVVQSFRRASRRCHPDNFRHLGEREQQLATRAYEKFEEARDQLLGVEV